MIKDAEQSGYICPRCDAFLNRILVYFADLDTQDYYCPKCQLQLRNWLYGKTWSVIKEDGSYERNEEIKVEYDSKGEEND